MSTGSKEQEPQLSLTDEVLTKSREAYDLLRALLDSGRASMYEDEDKTEEGHVLATAIGGFVTANAAALNDISTVERTPELQNAANAWLNTRLKHKLESAMFSEQLAQKKAELTALLEGKTVTATSLKYGFGVGDGYGVTSGPGSPMHVTAPFYAVEPALGTIWLGTAEQHYQVDLYDVMNPSEPASTIKVY